MRASLAGLGLGLAALGAGCAPTLIQPPQVAQLRRHEGPRVPLNAYVALELRAFDIRGGGPLHTKEILAPKEGIRNARAIIRQKIVESGLFEAVDEIEGEPPAGSPGVLLKVALDVVVTTPSVGATSFAPTAHVTGIYLGPGGSRQILFGNVPYETLGTAADNPLALRQLVMLVWRSGAEAIATLMANDLPQRLASSPTGASLLRLGSAPPPVAGRVGIPAPVGNVRPAAALANPYANSWAIVIGVNAYQKVRPRLNYAVPDAQAVAAALPALGFPPETTRVLLDAAATKARIETVLYKEFAAIGPDDRLFVFFAGHGETLPIRGGEEGYILPVDADPDALPLTAIAMDDVRRIGQRLKAKHAFFALDACFSGFALTRDVLPRATTDEYLAASLREPAVQVLTAGRKGERAIEEGGHGLFTRQLLEGLRGLADPEGRGLVTAAQLAAWIEPRVVRDSKGKMTPQYGRLEGEGQFVFILPRSP